MNATSSEEDDWQRIWFSTREKNWTSLALIPSDPGIDVLRIAEGLVTVGRLHGERPVNLVNATNLHLEKVQLCIEAISRMATHGEWVIVAVDAVVENPSSVAIVRSTSAALLVVRLGASLLPAAQAAIDTVGRDRFLGSVVLNETGGASSIVAV